MKDFLEVWFIEPFKNRDYGIGITVWFMSLMLFSPLSWVSLYFIDSSFLSQKEAKGIIINKRYTPGHFQTTYIQSGNILTPITNYIPDNYGIEIEINELTDDFVVTKKEWISLHEGDTLSCKFVSGRLFNSLYIRGFCA